MSGKLSVLFMAVVVAISSSVVGSRPAVAGQNGSQIAFAVANGAFDWLIIDGTNQNNDDVQWRWTEPIDNGWQNGAYAITTWNWWWKGYVRLEFYVHGVGVRRCTLDPPKLDNTDTSYVVYYPSRDQCTGGGGSVSSLSTLEALVDAVLYEDETTRFLEGMGDSVDCAEAFLKGLSGSRVSFVLSAMKCVGVDDGMLRDIARRHHKKVTIR